MIFRFLLLVFNVAVVGFLIYKMVGIAQQNVSRTRKTIVLVGGTVLLLAPIGIMFRFFGAAPQYFLVYPVAIFLFLYLTRQL